MTAWKLIPVTSTLVILIAAGFLGTSMLPATNSQLRLAASETAVAEFIVGRSIQSDEFDLRQLLDFEDRSETLRSSDNETLSGKGHWQAISNRAAELLYRLEAEIAWQLGRVASP